MGAGLIEWMGLTKGFINSAYRTPARSSVFSVERLKTTKLLSSWGQMPQQLRVWRVPGTPY